MPTPTYDLIASNVLSSSASSVTFSSISGSYRDLVLVANVQTDNALAALYLRFNGDTGSNYNFVRMAGNGSTATSSATANTTQIRSVVAQLDNVNFHLAIFNVFDYSATDKHKSVLNRLNKPNQGVEATAGRWASTNAITSITVSPDSNNFVSGSTFYLYGIVS